MSPESLISNSKVAAVVTDPRLPDNPIVACNAAFLALTGYSHDDVIGRNCRFLRGAGTEPEQTALLHEAITAERPVLIELTNYRQDGTAFRNAVMIAPLFDEHGKLRYFLGSQMQVDGAEPGRASLAEGVLAQLTRRQRQVLEAVAKGLLNKQIAHALSLTERTVKMHRSALLKALGVRTNAEAIRIAIEAGY